jgi:DNA-binding transcriptional LysR family regulator
VARHRSFHRAAEQLHLSQSALSCSIQALERQYGVRLFDRDRSGVELTSVGRQLLGRAADLLYNAGSIVDMLRGASAGTNGQVVFGIGPVIGAALLPDVLVGVHHDTPDLAVRVVTDPVEVMTDQLLAGELDFFVGIAGPAHVHERCAVRRFAESSPLFLVREGHPLLVGGPVTAEALRSFAKVSVSSWNQALAQLDVDFDRELVRASIEMDSYELLARFTERTDAVFVSTFRDPERRLAALPLDTRPVPSSVIGLFTLAARTLSPAAQAIADRLARTLQASPHVGEPTARRGGCGG